MSASTEHPYIINKVLFHNLFIFGTSAHRREGTDCSSSEATQPPAQLSSNKQAMRGSILPILFSIALLTSACCKEVCGDENVTFFYRNFTASEIDTVQYLFYVKDNLTTPADSMTMYYLGTNSTPQDFRNTVPVNLDRVIEVRIKSLGDTFRITDIQTDLADCNCSKGTFRQMKSFNIDGIRVIAREVEVIR